MTPERIGRLQQWSDALYERGEMSDIGWCHSMIPK